VNIDPSDPVMFPFKHGRDDKDPTGLKTMLIPAMLISGVAFVAIVVSKPAFLADAKFRWLLSVYFILWGIAYYQTSETAWRFWIGLMEILGAVWSNWYQLGQFASSSSQASRSDRLIFIAGGVALMASGVKDVVKGMKKMEKVAKDTSTPRPNTSTP
jgi:hypothetical protein